MARCRSCSFQGDISESKDHVHTTGHVVDAGYVTFKPGPEDGPQPRSGEIYTPQLGGQALSLVRETFLWVLASVAVSALLSATTIFPFPVFFVPLQLIYLALLFFRVERRKTPEARIVPRCPYCGKRIGGATCPNCGAEQ